MRESNSGLRNESDWSKNFHTGLGVLFTPRRSNPIRSAKRKSLRFGGDMKSNPVRVVVVQTGVLQSGMKSNPVLCNPGLRGKSVSSIYGGFWRSFQILDFQSFHP